MIIGYRWWIWIWWGILALGVGGLIGAIHWGIQTHWRNLEEVLRGIGTVAVSIGMVLLLHHSGGGAGQTLLLAAGSVVLVVLVAAVAVLVSGAGPGGSGAEGRLAAAGRVRGFQQFLGGVEKDQIARLENSPDLFEKYLPYAMALRVEKRWVQAFSGITLQPPQWYQGGYGSGFQPNLLVNDLSLMSSQAGSVMASSPRGSSGGSGFGGGGGSGGGSGGGGGGGF